VGNAAPVNVGIASISIFQGDPANGVVIGSNTATFLSSHTYTEADPGLSILAQLPLGLVTVVAYDVLGDSGSAVFVVVPPLGPSLSIGAAGLDEIYSDYASQDSVAAPPSTLLSLEGQTRDIQFNVTYAASDLKSVNLSGDGPAVLLDQNNVPLTAALP